MDHQNSYYNQQAQQTSVAQQGHQSQTQSGYSPQNQQQSGYNTQRVQGYGGQSQNGYQKRPYSQGGGYQSSGFQRKPKQEFGPIELYKPYAMVSNRDVPVPILGQMSEIAKLMDNLGFTCRIDGGEGASASAEPIECRKELILAWKGFNEKESAFTYNQPEAFEIAKLFHPTYDSLKPAIQAFLARNARVVMGQTLKSPIMFLVVYTEDGAETVKERTSKTGFAGHLIAMACGLGMPVFNLQKPDAYQRLVKQFGTKPDIQETPQRNDYGQSQESFSSFSNNH